MIAEEKKLGLVSVLGAGAGLIVATSCLLMLAQGAGVIHGAFIYALIIACILNMLAIGSLAELNALMPGISGGMPQYTLTALGAFPALITILGGYIMVNSFASSAEVLMCGLALEEFFSWSVPPWVVGVVVICILGFVNLRGINMFARTQNAVAYTLLGSLLVLGLIGIFSAGAGVTVDQPFMQEGDIAAVLALAPMAFWLFIGAEFIIPMAAEIKNPRRNVPLGMFMSLGIILVLMILTVFGISNYVLWADLGASNTPHIIYGVQVLGQFGYLWMGVIVILAAISTVNTVISACARICEGMAKMDLLPTVFKKRNRSNAPYAGILLIVVGLILVTSISQVADAEGLAVLILTGCTFWMGCYAIGHVNLLVMRKRLPDAPRSFKMPLGPVLPILGIAGMIWMILTIDPDPEFRWMIWRTCIITIVVFSIYSIIWIKVKMKRSLFKPMPVEEMMALEAQANAEQAAAQEARLAAIAAKEARLAQKYDIPGGGGGSGSGD